MLGSGGGTVQPPNGGNSAGSATPPDSDNAEKLDSIYGAGENYSRLFALLDEFGKNDTPWRNQTTLNIEAGEGMDGENGNYVSISPNQVEDVEEPDIIKMTDKYIFRIGGVIDGGEALRIYTIDGENSTQVCEYPIPYFDGSKYSVGAKMFLSEDGNTVTVIKDYISNSNNNGIYKTAVLLLDVSNIESPVQKELVIINGLCSFARISGDRLIIGSSFYATRSGYDWSDPREYLPYYEKDGNTVYLSPNEIICPDVIYERSYTTFTMLDTDLDIISSKAVWGMSGTPYISQNKIILSMGYGRKYEENLGDDMCCKTDIAIIDYSADSFKTDCFITVDGWVEDRFFVDECDGYLRIVTNKYKYLNKYSVASVNSSLYIYNIKKSALVNSVVNFAPEGEQATAVRFDGDKLYVCTAEITSFLDPIFFFDLSDYNNITQVNTGFIDGFSSSLISYGNGYLLGIGPKDRETNKVSVYKQQGDRVITVADYYFKGAYAIDRKAFIIDTERGLFGFGANSYYDDNGVLVDGAYILLHFDGSSLNEIAKLEINHSVSSLRAVYCDGYLYILKNTAMQLEEINYFD